MPLSRSCRWGALLVSLACVSAPASAQQTATFDLAVYIPQPIVIQVDRPLQFPKLIPGGRRVIVPTSTNLNAARIRVTGAPCALVDVRFNLPSTVLGPAGATLPVDTYTAEWQNGTNVVAPFTPASTAIRLQFDHSGLSCLGPAGAYTDDETGTLTLRLGATARATEQQTPGRYVSTLTILIAYVDL